MRREHLPDSDGKTFAAWRPHLCRESRPDRLAHTVGIGSREIGPPTAVVKGKSILVGAILCS